MEDANKLKKRIRWALERIMEDDNAPGVRYAVDYTEHGLKMMDEGCKDEDLQTQLLYVRSNITHWRGKQAKAVRSIVKQATHALCWGESSKYSVKSQVRMETGIDTRPGDEADDIEGQYYSD